MMDENLLCLFTARVEEIGGSFVIDVPEREIELGGINLEETYRLAVLSEREEAVARTATTAERKEPDTPVAEGEIVDLEVENLGDKGDGIARVGPGYVVIVPETSPGERVSAEITEVRENVAFAEVVDRFDR